MGGRGFSPEPRGRAVGDILFLNDLHILECDGGHTCWNGKPAVLAVPFEEDDPETAALLIAFFEKSLRYLQMNLIGCIVVPSRALAVEVRLMINRIAYRKPTNSEEQWQNVYGEYKTYYIRANS